MTDSQKLANTISAFIEKNLLGNAPFRSTSEFISFIAYKESQKKLNTNSKLIK